MSDDVEVKPKTFSEKWHEEKERKKKLKKEKKDQQQSNNNFNPANQKINQPANQVKTNKPQKKSAGRGR